MFDGYTREQLRRSYAEAWTKHLVGVPLTALQAEIIDVISAHPEYQGVVGDVDTALSFEPGSSGVADNPFLHMGLHLAVREQLSIDRPPGVRDLHRQLQARYGDSHRAEHVLMEALGETLWQAQRSGLPPDEAQYLALARNRLK
ncbi:MAG TPA: DUF1841 family protein [Steroidobacteraceae bacterium]|nr:DUF1841 family protein [Steroidobacteraceae bacterium]